MEIGIAEIVVFIIAITILLGWMTILMEVGESCRNRKKNYRK